MQVKFLDPDNLCHISTDPLHRIVRMIKFICPCGKEIRLWITKEAPFWLTPDPDKQPKAWHYELNANLITVSPSIDLTKSGHPAQCHFSIVNQSWIEEFDR